VIGSSGLSWKQAVAVRDHVRAREPFRLQDLARRMAATGGPVDQMDASFASLVPLWAWFDGFVLDGCPGIDPDDAMPSMLAKADMVPPDSPQWELARRYRPASVATEGIEHYLRLVWLRFDPPAHWDVYVTPRGARVPDDIHHSTGVVTSTGGFWDMSLVQSIKLSVIEDRMFARRPEALLEWAVRQEGWSTAPAQDRGPSVLVPLLDADLGPMPPAAAVSPVWDWPKEWWKARPAPLPAQPTVGEPMTLWRGRPDDLDEPARLAALPADEVARVLAAAGLVAEHGPIDGPGLLASADADGFVELAHPQETIQAQVIVADGAVRAVHVEPLAPSRAQWTALTSALRNLARTTGARLVRDDHME